MEQPATGSSIVATPPASGGDGEKANHHHHGDPNTPKMTMYRGVWLDDSYLPLMKAAHEEYRARPSDIFLATYPKCGTTWLKALAYAIAFCELHSPRSPEHPLLTNNPHELVFLLEAPPTLSRKKGVVGDNFQDLESQPSPRLIQTHLPYKLFPEPAMAPLGSGGSRRIVYLCREPKDAFVSWVHFVKQSKKSLRDTCNMTIDQLLDYFCDGTGFYGTLWDHAREFWEQSNKDHARVLFFRYEEMLRDPSTAAKRLAEFIGFPFSGEEVEGGVVEDVVELCSLENLKKQEVNKDGFIGDEVVNSVLKKAAFFRSGRVGDWRNHMTPKMANRVDGIVKEKLQGTGLAFVE